jgi:hypothetical protein
MRTIRASEIGSYLFCRRAWKYQRQGLVSENTVELASGTTIHRQHGREVISAGCLRTVAAGMLLTSIVMFVWYFGVQIL